MGKQVMGKIERNPNGTLSRRGFLEGSAGLTFALSIPGALFAPRVALADNATPAALGAWVTIGADGAIVLAIPVAEMGQGSLTGLAMVFAEEMDADWSRVSTTYPPVKPEIFGNPIFGGHDGDLWQRLDPRLLGQGAAAGRRRARRADAGGRRSLAGAAWRIAHRAESRGARGEQSLHELRRDRGLCPGVRRPCRRSTSRR